MCIGKLTKLEYLVIRSLIRASSANSSAESLRLMVILQPRTSESSSAGAMLYVPVPSDVHVAAAGAARMVPAGASARPAAAGD